MEKYVERPRHIEIQVIADAHGNIVHLGERECSVQRRHQKVIEEVSVSGHDSGTACGHGRRRRAAGKRCGIYECRHGGVPGRRTAQFYFLEVNTRLQVEHPVTEMVTGLDLVKLQIRVAEGESLPFSQDDIRLSGHAIECRLYAEDAHNQFFPSPGKILSRRAPSGPGIRLDDGVYEGFVISTEYDPMLGKLIAWGADRAEAIARLDRALEEHSVTGIENELRTSRSAFSAIRNSVLEKSSCDGWTNGSQICWPGSISRNIPRPQKMR